MNSKINSGFIIPIIIILALIILGAIAYFFSPKQINSVSVKIPTSSPAVSVDKTVTAVPSSIWKNYINSKIGFSLSYPNDWKIMSDSGTRVSFGAKSDESSNLSIESNIRSPYSIENESDQVSQIEAHKNYYLNSTSFADNGGSQISKEEIKVDGKRSFRYVLQPLVGNKPEGNPVVWIYILQDSNSIIRISLYGSKLTQHNQILSTFKFTK